MLMRGHGSLTLGKTVGRAFMSAFYLEKACQFQVLAQSTGVPHRHETAQHFHPTPPLRPAGPPWMPPLSRIRGSDNPFTAAC